MSQEFQHSIGFLIKIIQDSYEKETNLMMKNLNLTSQQARILMYLNSCKDNKTTQKDIEEFFNVSHPTVVGLLKRLEQKEFLQTYFSPDDKRIKIIQLSKQDERLNQSIHYFTHEIEHTLLSGLSTQEIQQLRALLLKVYHNIR